MYERSAIVLERFFSNLLGFNQVNNLKQNFNNYCQLFEKFKTFQQSIIDETAALKEFQAAESKIEEIQNQEEKLYKKNAKLEYNRDLVFQDISPKPEEIEKCSIKIESDIQKNQDKLVSLREEFVEAIKDYNQKKSDLAKCKKIRKSAESEYNIIFEETKNNIDNIPEEYIQIAQSFSTSDIHEEIINALAENGKDEKIPFNNQVITNAAKIGFEIWSREVECYLEAYKLAQKLVNELLDGAVSVELHEKSIRNISAKISFLETEKEYIVGFLDYERITVIYGKRMHRNLMIDACEKLELDIKQVENLYSLLLKEIADKSTKKAYKELYNKSYLMEMEDKDAKFKKEKNRVNLSTGTIMNSNYWRIEGIKNIYTVFYKNVVEVFGRDLDEFEIPKVQDENLEEDNNSEVQDFGQDSELIEMEENSNKLAEQNETEQESNTINYKDFSNELQEGEIDLAQNSKTANLIDVQKVDTESEEEHVEHIAEETIENKSEISDLEARLDSFLDEIDDLEDDEYEQSNKTKDNKKKVIMEIKKEPVHIEEQELNVTDEVNNKEILKKELEVIEEIKFENNSDTKKTLKLAKRVKKRGRKKVKHFTRKIAQIEETIQISEQENNPVIEEIEQSKVSKTTKTSKANKKTEVEEVNSSIKEDFDIFGEKYKDIDSEIAELDDLEDDLIIKNEVKENNYKIEDDDFEEESIFDTMEEDDNIDFDEIDFEETTRNKKTKKKIFDSFKKLGSKSKKKITN